MSQEIKIWDFSKGEQHKQIVHSKRDDLTVEDLVQEAHAECLEDANNAKSKVKVQLLDVNGVIVTGYVEMLIGTVGKDNDLLLVGNIEEVIE